MAFLSALAQVLAQTPQGPPLLRGPRVRQWPQGQQSPQGRQWLRGLPWLQGHGQRLVWDGVQLLDGM